MAGPAHKLVGLEFETRRIARQGTPIIDGAGTVVGEVTSGTCSPTLGKSIAMAYVDAALTADGTTLAADLKGTANPARVVKLPFYSRSQEIKGQESEDLNSWHSWRTTTTTRGVASPR